LALTVTKANGFKQPFNKDKVIRTAMRMGASRKTAYEIAEKIEQKLYDGMPSAKILQLIFLYMRKDKPNISHLYDLRKGLSLMDSKPEFEKFIQTLLANNGFEVTQNQILTGKCGQHEVDAIAVRNGVKYLVEIKHHYSYHALTGLDESRIARAILEDVNEGYELGTTKHKIDNALLVTNTKYSDQAIKYAGCRNILLIGWNSPPNLSVQSMIEEKNLYPLSCLRSLRRSDRARLVDSGIVLIRQISEEAPASISKKTGLPQHVLEKIREQIELDS
jgi:HJR/Mrr/RecB family endonuclease